MRLARIEGDGWEEALKLYKAQADDLHAGRTPRMQGDGLTVKDLGDLFLNAKLRKRTAGEIGARMLEEYREICQLMADAFGKNRHVDDLAAADFEQLRACMAERWGPVRLGNAITRVKSVFKYGADNGLFAKAVRYGTEFKKPDKATLRKHKAQRGRRMLEAKQLREVLSEQGTLVVGKTGPELARAGIQLRAMILLGLNCGFGNHDVATLPLMALDLDGGWISFPRPKTGIDRRCPLWPETVEALRRVIAERRALGSGLLFLNSRGLPWVRFTEKSRTDTVSVQFCELLKKLGYHREGVSFYTLRHVFRTAADSARDSVATDLIMGHADPTMGAQYREHVDDSRLRAVAEHVRVWLFPSPPAPDTTPETSDPCDPCDPEEKAGSEGSQGSLKIPTSSALLRLYVG
jgi:integrase